MSRARSLCGLAMAAAVAAALAGCQSSAPAVRRPSAVIDPCAERLHAICGHLLFYHFTHGRLPAALADLPGNGPDPLPPFTCPSSGQPYVYNPDGLVVPGHPGRLIVYDAAASHAGMRWGILAEIPPEGRPLTARVVLLPDVPAAD